ncbi:MAG: Ldh family oxidoreductase [Bdellovibrionales bacterium]
MKVVSYKKLEQRVPEFLQQFFEPEAAENCAEVMLYAERRGIDGQGLLKLIGTTPLQNIKPVMPIEVQHQSVLSARLLGNRQPSFYIAQKATQVAIEKVTSSGVGIVGANGIFSSVGALGFYAEKIARHDAIAIVMARAPGTIAAFGAKTPLFGTNPLAVAFPTEDGPFVVDMATSAITWYELVMAKMRGQKIPDGVAIDKNGDVTTDPVAAMDGAILPFDKSYKGSALAMIVEMMAGPLSGSTWCDFETFDKDWGLFILAFNPNLLVDLAEFKHNASDLLRIVRAQEMADGSRKVRLPGDRSREHERRILETDMLELDDEVAILLGLE